MTRFEQRPSNVTPIKCHIEIKNYGCVSGLLYCMDHGQDLRFFRPAKAGAGWDRVPSDDVLSWELLKPKKESRI